MADERSAPMTAQGVRAIALCPSADLREGGDGFSFEVRHYSQRCPAFVVRHDGQVQAYLNRCSHVPMEMDFQANRFFDVTGRWLICSTHGALYSPQTGACVGGPCRGGLIKIAVSEAGGWVHWHTAPHLEPLDI